MLSKLYPVTFVFNKPVQPPEHLGNKNPILASLSKNEIYELMREVVRNRKNSHFKTCWQTSTLANQVWLTLRLRLFRVGCVWSEWVRLWKKNKAVYGQRERMLWQWNSCFKKHLKTWATAQYKTSLKKPELWFYLSNPAWLSVSQFLWSSVRAV